MSIGADALGMDHSRLADALLSHLPEHLRAPLASLRHLPSCSREDLLAELDRYSRLIDAEANRRGDLDVELADELLRAYKILLETQWGDLSTDQQHLVQLSCRYYLDPGDEEGDLSSVFGFDDDALVLNQTLELISRPDLKILV